MSAKKKSRKQIGFLLSDNSPLTFAQKMKLKRELHSGEVTIKKNGKAKKGRKHK